MNCRRLVEQAEFPFLPAATVLQGGHDLTEVFLLPTGAVSDQISLKI